MPGYIIDDEDMGRLKGHLSPMKTYTHIYNDCINSEEIKKPLYLCVQGVPSQDRRQIYVTFQRLPADPSNNNLITSYRLVMCKAKGGSGGFNISVVEPNTDRLVHCGGGRFNKVDSPEVEDVLISVDLDADIVNKYINAKYNGFRRSPATGVSYVGEVTFVIHSHSCSPVYIQTSENTRPVQLRITKSEEFDQSPFVPVTEKSVRKTEYKDHMPYLCIQGLPEYDRQQSYLRFEGLPEDIIFAQLTLTQCKSANGGFVISLSTPSPGLWKKEFTPRNCPRRDVQVGGGRFNGSGSVTVRLDVNCLKDHMFKQQKKKKTHKGRVCLIIHSQVCGRVYIHGMKDPNYAPVLSFKIAKENILSTSKCIEADRLENLRDTPLVSFRSMLSETKTTRTTATAAGQFDNQQNDENTFELEGLPYDDDDRGVCVIHERHSSLSLNSFSTSVMNRIHHIICTRCVNIELPLGSEFGIKDIQGKVSDRLHDDTFIIQGIGSVYKIALLQFECVPTDSPEYKLSLFKQPKGSGGFDIIFLPSYDWKNENNKKKIIQVPHVLIGGGRFIRHKMSLNDDYIRGTWITIPLNLTNIIEKYKNNEEYFDLTICITSRACSPVKIMGPECEFPPKLSVKEPEKYITRDNNNQQQLTALNSGQLFIHHRIPSISSVRSNNIIMCPVIDPPTTIGESCILRPGVRALFEFNDDIKIYEKATLELLITTNVNNDFHFEIIVHLVDTSKHENQQDNYKLNPNDRVGALFVSVSAEDDSIPFWHDLELDVKKISNINTPSNKSLVLVLSCEQQSVKLYNAVICIPGKQVIFLYPTKVYELLCNNDNNNDNNNDDDTTTTASSSSSSFVKKELIMRGPWILVDDSPWDLSFKCDKTTCVLATEALIMLYLQNSNEGTLTVRIENGSDFVQLGCKDIDNEQGWVSISLDCNVLKEHIQREQKEKSIVLVEDVVVQDDDDNSNNVISLHVVVSCSVAVSTASVKSTYPPRMEIRISD